MAENSVQNLPKYSLQHFWNFSENQLVQILNYFSTPPVVGRNRLAAIFTCYNHSCFDPLDRPIVAWSSFATLVELEESKFNNYYAQIVKHEVPLNRGIAIRNLWLKLEPNSPEKFEGPEKLAKVVCVKVADIRPDYANLKEWMKNPNHVYIGRKGPVFVDGERFPKEDSLWANPYRVKDHNQSTIPLFEEYIRKKLATGEIPIYKLLELRGKQLGCWCKTKGQDIPCHGDVLVKLLAEHANS